MKDRTVYVVTAGYSPESYSIQYDLVGVYLAKETAEDKVRKLKLRDIFCRIHEVKIGREYPVEESWRLVKDEKTIGGYIE